jgi:glutaconate CoA-transferase, subunit B
VLEPDPATQEFVLTGLYPGVSVADARSRTGWDLAAAADLPGVDPPSPSELTALRGFTSKANAKG